MQSHTDMFRNQAVLCRIREVAAMTRRIAGFDLSFLTFILLLAIMASVGVAAESTPAGRSVTPPGKPETPAFPYYAEIIGDNVYFRSGPGTNFYECGKLNKGDKVKVVSKQFTWYRIVPPAKSFAWISTQYVNVDPARPGFGIVTGDRVRVYAGSNRVKPHYSTSLLGKLNKDEKVTLLGQELDGYHKIAPPPSAYLWVSTNFTKPLPKPISTTANITPAETKQPATVVKPAPGEVPKVVKIDSSAEPGATDPNAAAEPVPAKIVYKSKMEHYQALRKRIEAEKAKPEDKQDYAAIKKELLEIINSKAESDADKKAARYSQFVLRLVEGCELALASKKKTKAQSEQLTKAKAEIDKARNAKLAEVKNLGRYAAIGTLQNFTLYGPGNYRLVDETGRMLCYALPSDKTKQADVSKLIGKKVGVVGTIQPHLPTKKAMVRFSEIVALN
ncbi:MAG: SH3 domain-containing protein [Planctomycetota bacterium]|jgi:hypothetical protein